MLRDTRHQNITIKVKQHCKDALKLDSSKQKKTDRQIDKKKMVSKKNKNMSK